LSQTSKCPSQPTKSTTNSSCGVDVVRFGGDPVGLGEGGVELLGAQEELDHARLNHWLCLIDGGALGDNLAEIKSSLINLDEKMLRNVQD